MTLGLCAVPLLIAGCAGDDGKTQQRSRATPDAVVVSIGDNFYKPASLTVRENQSITWRNDGLGGHTVTSGSFDSGTLEPGSSWADVRLAKGTYTYRCRLHPTQSGTITVTG